MAYNYKIFGSSLHESMATDHSIKIITIDNVGNADTHTFSVSFQEVPLTTDSSTSTIGGELLPFFLLSILFIIIGVSLGGYIVYMRKKEKRLIFFRSKLADERISFFCQLDNEQHPSTDSGYKCKNCSRMVCDNCYDRATRAGMLKCPYCSGNLTNVQ